MCLNTGSVHDSVKQVPMKSDEVKYVILRLK